MDKPKCKYLSEYQDMGARFDTCSFHAPVIELPHCDDCKIIEKEKSSGKLLGTEAKQTYIDDLPSDPEDSDNIKVDYDKSTRTLSANICLNLIFPFKLCETECPYKAVGYGHNYIYCMNSGICRNAIDLFLRSKKGVKDG